MQGWSLERKIQVTQTRLLEWYQKNDNKCYVSFSGGKDEMITVNELTPNNIKTIGETGKDIVYHITDQIDKVINDKDKKENK